MLNHKFDRMISALLFKFHHFDFKSHNLGFYDLKFFPIDLTSQTVHQSFLVAPLIICEIQPSMRIIVNPLKL